MSRRSPQKLGRERQTPPPPIAGLKQSDVVAATIEQPARDVDGVRRPATPKARIAEHKLGAAGARQADHR